MLLKTCLLVLLLKNFVSAQFDGDDCVRSIDDAKGICKRIRECPSARDEYLKGIQLQICSYERNQPIICCPIEKQSAQRKSELMCREYDKLTRERTMVWGLTLENNSNQGGIETFKCNPSTPLIYGGVETSNGEFPHMAALGWKINNQISFKCGGSLISDTYVLTAAHCEKANGVSPSFVRLGDQNLKSKTDGANEVDINIAEFIRHPKYSRVTLKNDIALLKLASTVSFTNYIRPACLWQTDYINATQTVATGWGRLEYASDTSDTLMKVQLDVINNKQCDEIIHEALALRAERRIDNTQMCAGVLEGGKDTCQGDSGGPLQLVTASNLCLYHIIGVTSFGATLCGSAIPAVYTRVSSFLDWIEPIVWGP